MGFHQYHEPPEELSEEARTFARMITSLTEEAEAIGWYEQRLSIEKDNEAKAIMQNAQQEEMKHFGMDLNFCFVKSLNGARFWRVCFLAKEKKKQRNADQTLTKQTV